MGGNAANAAPELAGLLTNRSYEVRHSAAFALFNVAENTALVASQAAEMPNSPSAGNRSSAAVASAGAGSPGTKFTPQELALQLTNLLNPNEFISVQAYEPLGEMGTNAVNVAPLLTERLIIYGGLVRENTEAVLLRITAQPDPKVALRLIEASHDYLDSRGEFILWAYLMGGVDETNLARIIWLSSRDDQSRPKVNQLDHSQAYGLLASLSTTFALAENLPKTKTQLAQLTADLVRSQGLVEAADRRLVLRLRDELIRQGFPDQARTLDDALNDKTRKIGLVIIRVGAIHLTFWILLIFFYPRFPMIQACFFWSKWPRKMFGLFYVDLAIRFIPFLRQRLFKPFRDSLIPRRLVADYDAENYFQKSEVREEIKGKWNQRQSLLTAIGVVKGHIVLQGQSGLGKTLLLQRLAVMSAKTVVYLRATDCANGVVAAIQTRLHGKVRDSAYLKTLIYAGALDVLIDGLNEASPETRIEITHFVEEHFKGNFVLTTQAMSWSVPATARVFALQPLRHDQIRNFMVRQWVAIQSVATITREQYGIAVDAYLSAIPHPGDPVRAPDRKWIVLCNPMDAVLAAELLAQGESPDLFRLVEQRFRTMARTFLEKNGCEFRLRPFAERVYEWRKSDRAYIALDGFEKEARELSVHRLMIQRADEVITSKGNQTRTEWFFRHDRIMEFFLLPAFMDQKHKKRRFDHIEDERFWGVYELLAVQLSSDEEQELYQFLNKQAAKTNQNELRNRYELARGRPQGVGERGS
jgi:hypothetical protein